MRRPGAASRRPSSPAPASPHGEPGVRRLAALLLPVLWLAAGCADMLELQYDPIGDVRPSTLVNRLQQDVANFKATWEPQRKGGYGPVDYQIGELAKAANAMEEDSGPRAADSRSSSRRRTRPGPRSRSSSAGGRPPPSSRAGSRFARRSTRWRPSTGGPTPRRSTPRRRFPRRRCRRQEPRPTTTTLVPDRAGPEAVRNRAEGVGGRAGAPSRDTVGKGARGRAGRILGGADELTRVKSGKKAEVVPVATRLGRCARTGWERSFVTTPPSSRASWSRSGPAPRDG